jgi:hypothetical protein
VRKNLFSYSEYAALNNICTYVNHHDCALDCRIRICINYILVVVVSSQQELTLIKCLTLASFQAGLFEVVLEVRASVILPVVLVPGAPVAKSFLSHAFEPLAAVCSPSGILLPRQPSSAYIGAKHSTKLLFAKP